MIKLTTALLLLTSSPACLAATVAEGQSAYQQNKVAEAEKIYAAVAAGPGSTASDRADASRELGRIAWLVDGKADEALRHLASAQSAAAKLCETGWMEARVLREAGRHEQALARGPILLAGCDDPAKRDLIGLQLIRTRLDLAVAERSRPDRQLALAMADLSRLGIDAASSLEGAAARLEVGLLRGDAPTALQGWKDYFWLADENSPPALSSFDADALFKRGLAADAADKDRVELAYLLMRAGFADAARRFAKRFRLPESSSNPRWRLLVAYWNERDKLKAVELRVNRSLARGGARDDQTLENAAKASLGQLMAAAGATGDPREAVLEHYGLLGSVGLTSGYPSMHIGHIVDDRKEAVTQYGKRAKVRFAAIDNMWANGFETWLWDGHAAAGGWSGNGMIVQVRPEYTDGPVTAFALVGDGRARRELLARLPAREAEDLTQAATAKMSTLNGLSDRLRLQVIDQIAAAARSKAGSGDIRRAFLDEYWRATLQHSIFIHEGRHAIDQATAADSSELDNETLEYQAKLSELALADYPRLALLNMNRGIGGTSPHDRAGTRIFEAFSVWIRAHSDEVLGYDPAVPTPVQIDKLSDGQIREIARSLDPLARGGS